eukprot:m.73090 g.73090  ORF g.73090 m.73090 type:complete len:86 (-) comp8411_c0_seq4:3457-3714(-)
MSAAQKLLQSFANAPVKGVFGWVRSNLTPSQAQKVGKEFTTSYSAKYFKSGSVKPVVHVMLGLGVIGYALEYPHLKHSQRNRKHH